MGQYGEPTEDGAGHRREVLLKGGFHEMGFEAGYGPGRWSWTRSWAWGGRGTEPCWALGSEQSGRRRPEGPGDGLGYDLRAVSLAVWDR